MGWSKFRQRNRSRVLTVTPVQISFIVMVTNTAPAPTPYRFTRDEYYRMAEAGLFQDQHVELLDGEIITMSPKLTPHAFTVNQLMYTLIAALGSTAIVRVQDPIVLNNNSEPEPDIAICLPVPDKYKQAHPTADQVIIVIEVAESSLTFDRTWKARSYAGARIPEYWIVNLVDRQVEVLTDPDASSRNYRQRRVVMPHEELILPGGNSLAISSILS
jgi:Uma2 family endonuclease